MNEWYGKLCLIAQHVNLHIFPLYMTVKMTILPFILTHHRNNSINSSTVKLSWPCSRSSCGSRHCSVTRGIPNSQTTDQCPLFGVERCLLLRGSKCISSMVKSIGAVRCTEVVRFSEGLLLEVLLYQKYNLYSTQCKK